MRLTLIKKNLNEKINDKTNYCCLNLQSYKISTYIQIVVCMEKNKFQIENLSIWHYAFFYIHIDTHTVHSHTSIFCGAYVPREWTYSTEILPSTISPHWLFIYFHLEDRQYFESRRQYYLFSPSLAVYPRCTIPPHPTNPMTYFLSLSISLSFSFFLFFATRKGLLLNDRQ